MIRHLRPALLILVLLTLVTGVAYPLAVTGVAQVVFPVQANGSLLSGRGHARGSRLIGQPFDEPRYFWGRLSATGPAPFNAGASSGSNFGPLNPALRQAAQARTTALHEANPTQHGPVPVDLVTSSGSGLDPDISPAAALWQVPRVARARHLPASHVRDIVMAHVEGRTLGILGVSRP